MARDKKWELAPSSYLRRTVAALLLALRAFSGSSTFKWYFKPGNSPNARARRRHFVEAYVCGVTIFLIGALFADHDSRLVLWLSGYFVAEIIAITLAVRFLNPLLYGPKHLEDPDRSILLLLIGYAEVTIGFAQFYLADGGIKDGCKPLANTWDALYFSVVTITTLGYGDFSPTTQESRVLVCLELTCGILLIVFMLGTFLSVNEDDRSDGRNQ